MSNILVDTNVLIYSFDPTSIFNTRAANVLQNEAYNIYITTKNISEFFAVCTKMKYDQKIISGFYEDLKINTTILFPDKKSLNIFETFMAKYHPKGNRVFDMEIVSVMLANHIDKIATFNIKDFADIDEIELLKLS